MCVSRGRAVKQEVSDGAPRRRGEYLSALALGVGAQPAHESLGLGESSAQLSARLGRARAEGCLAVHGCCCVLGTTTSAALL